MHAAKNNYFINGAIFGFCFIQNATQSCDALFALFWEGLHLFQHVDVFRSQHHQSAISHCARQIASCLLWDNNFSCPQLRNSIQKRFRVQLVFSTALLQILMHHGAKIMRSIRTNCKVRVWGRIIEMLNGELKCFRSC